MRDSPSCNPHEERVRVVPVASPLRVVSGGAAGWRAEDDRRLRRGRGDVALHIHRLAPALARRGRARHDAAHALHAPAATPGAHRDLRCRRLAARARRRALPAPARVQGGARRSSGRPTSSARATERVKFERARGMDWFVGPSVGTPTPLGASGTHQTERVSRSPPGEGLSLKRAAALSSSLSLSLSLSLSHPSPHPRSARAAPRHGSAALGGRRRPCRRGRAGLPRRAPV